MMKRNILFSGIFIMFVLALPQSLSAQSQMDIRFNEVLTINENSLIDNYGDHVPWFELYNTAYNTINLSGMYLTDDLNNPKKYMIPNDPRMKLEQMSYVVFYADDKSERGSFHTNFKLDSCGTIALFASDGRTLVDSVSFQFAKADMNLKRLIDGKDKWTYDMISTPNQSNYIGIKRSSADDFIEYDPIGIAMAIIAMFVVMAALTLLYLLFKIMGRHFRTDKAASKSSSKSVEEPSPIRSESELTGEINAAIALAISIYLEDLHDYEATFVTINKVTRPYSPWSSKLYSLRQIPNHITNKRSK